MSDPQRRPRPPDARRASAETAPPPRPPTTEAPAPRRAHPHGEALPESLFRRFLPEVDHRTVGEILTHPGFARMRRSYIPGTMANYEIAVFPGGWQSAAYRTAAIGAIVCLWAAYDPADRATWPTLARLKQAVSTLGLSSARQIDDFVGRLAETGQIALERPSADGRLRLLRPTGPLLAWDREMLGSYYEALQILYPEPGYGIAIARDPVFQLVHRRCSIRVFPVIAGILAANTDLLPFYNMAEAVQVLMVLANLQADDPEAPARVRDFSGIRERHGVSRSHIRNILVATEAGGLVAWTGEGRKSFSLTPRGIRAIDIFIASTLACHDLSFRLALAEPGRDPDTSARQDG